MAIGHKLRKYVSTVIDKITGRIRRKDPKRVAIARKVASKLKGKRRPRSIVAKARAALIKTLQTGRTVWNRPSKLGRHPMAGKIKKRGE